MPEVGVILGSDSDLPKIKECFRILDDFGVDYEVIISSAHRTPEQTKEWAVSVKDRGMKAVIAVAGGAAHLPGVVASHTILPVIGVPVETKVAGGLDSILSIIQMPSGIPVGAMPAGRAGGGNAALYAISMLALCDDKYADKLKEFRKATEEKITKKNREINSAGLHKYIKSLEEKQ